MSADIRIDIVLPLTDKDIADQIMSVASKQIVSWQEILSMFKHKGVSSYKIRRILVSLLSQGSIIELKCRLFTTKEYLRTHSPEELKEEIKDVIRRIGLRKCGKPIGVPLSYIDITVTRKGEIVVNIPSQNIIL